VILPHRSLELRASYKERWVWAGAVIFSSVTCPLQFAKASAATLPQQEKNNSADLQRGRVTIFFRLYLYSGKLVLAAKNLRQAFIDGRSAAASAPALTHVCTVGACGTKPPRGPPAAETSLFWVGGLKRFLD
jgi:hypothetical protein